MAGQPPLKFEIIKRLGKGQFSTVYKAIWIDPPEDEPVVHSSEEELLRKYQRNCLAQIDGAGLQAADPPSLLGQQQFRAPETPPTLINMTSSNAGSIDLEPDRVPMNQGRQKEKLVAIKRIELCEQLQNSQARMDYLKEVQLLQQVKHPNIINFYISFIERNELFIILELADGGDLSRLIKYFQRKKCLIPEQTILKYFTQVSLAVEHIHSRRILHRDIKPANIFMTSDGCVKLGDFGLSRFFSQNTRDAHSIVGTFYYMSPERIRESGYSFSSDVWSLGCVLYELITLNSPFSIYNQNQQRHHHHNHHHPHPHHQTTQMGNSNLSQQTPVVYDGRGPSQQQMHMQQQPPPPPHNNQFNLEWLFDRITRADYPSLEGYTHISPKLRQLAAQCLNPSPETRPDMQYVSAVVYEALRIVGGSLPMPTKPLQSRGQPEHGQFVQANDNKTLTPNTSYQTLTQSDFYPSVQLHRAYNL